MNRIPAMRTGVPCNENRFFPVRISTQGKACSGPVLTLYRIAVNTLQIYPIYCLNYSFYSVQIPMYVFGTFKIQLLPQGAQGVQCMFSDLSVRPSYSFFNTSQFPLYKFAV